MSVQPELVEYYAKRAREYERVYEKPERQSDLARLHEIVPALLAGRHVLEIACGTGYWTAPIAFVAHSITAVDLAAETLLVARTKPVPVDRVRFLQGDAFALDSLSGVFDAAFAGFWWSHIRLEDQDAFLNGLHRRLAPGSRIVLVDNQYVPGSNHPITRTDAAGNTFQERSLASGERHEVLKNFPSVSALRTALVSAGGCDVDVRSLEYYWIASYSLPDAA
jgi:demethylmenaquinone methyltransferase/2-methoxy-6-polyprenyl-1,4-benzoquinol methylase